MNAWPDTVERLPADAILVPEGRRALNQAQVEALVESIGQFGLMQPITVRMVGDDAVLVAGHHRLQAALALGWYSIPCFVHEDIDALQAELAEIDENLVRAELGPAERATATARRKAIWEDLFPETRHGAVGKHRPKSQSGQVGHSEPADRFTTDTAARTGRSERDIRREARRGQNIAPEVLDQVRADPTLDKGTVLDTLAKTPRAEQAQKLSEIAAARQKPKPRSQVDHKTAEEAEVEAIDAVLRKVNGWPGAWRVKLIERLLDQEQPVFDRGRS